MSRTLADDLATPILDRVGIRGGLTKREEFAKAAMQGIMAGQPDLGIIRSVELAVEASYALIEALNRVEE